MHTDWLIVRRIATELNLAVGGARVTDVGMLDDGRVGLQLRAAGRGPATVVLDVFGSPPLVTLEETELALGIDSGFARAAGATLRGMRLATVTTPTDDRLLLFHFGARSRFGVENEVRLVTELVPRFGNLVLLKGSTVVAALKQFSPAENAERSIQTGGPYHPPPAAGPTLPRLLADSLAGGAPGTPATLLAQARAAADDPGAPVYVYRHDGRIVEVHLAPLTQEAALELHREPALLPLLAQATAQRRAQNRSSAAERRRARLVRRLEQRLASFREERARVAARQADAAGRERLRRWGEALYAVAADVPPGATRFSPPWDAQLEIPLDPELEPKAQAAEYFARYRKLTAALPHLEQRLGVLAQRIASFETLAWEAGRADPGALDEIEAAAAELDGARPCAPPGPGRRVRGRRSTPLEVRLPSGARIAVGRTPSQNVDLTFRSARPEDLWFHARNIPGAHVVLHLADGRPPTDDEIAQAADLAALHSRAATSERVDIDYTTRKYVRKQRDAAPGLVWYTHFKTTVGRPARAALYADKPPPTSRVVPVT